MRYFTAPPNAASILLARTSAFRGVRIIRAKLSERYTFNKVRRDVWDFLTLYRLLGCFRAVVKVKRAFAPHAKCFESFHCRLAIGEQHRRRS